MPPCEKMNLIEISLLFTTKGTQVKKKNEFMACNVFFFFKRLEKHLVCDPHPVDKCTLSL